MGADCLVFIDLMNGNVFIYFHTLDEFKFVCFEQFVNLRSFDFNDVDTHDVVFCAAGVFLGFQSHAMGSLRAVRAIRFVLLFFAQASHSFHVPRRHRLIFGQQGIDIVWHQHALRFDVRHFMCCMQRRHES